MWTDRCEREGSLAPANRGGGLAGVLPGVKTGRSITLAVCDARSMVLADFVPTDLLYRDRTGEVYSVAYNSNHRWFYFPQMQPTEALLLKCFDSDPARTRFTAHSAFEDPNTPPDAAPRQSIEVRAFAFFAE